MFSPGRMKAFDRTTVNAGLMDATAWPGKTYQSAKVAWRDAQAAGERFRQAKFDLQKRVLDAWTDYALLAERQRIQRENLSLLRLVADTAASRVRAGSAQQEQLRADVALRLAQNELETLAATLRQQQARLNGMLLRPADAPLSPPVTFPSPRTLTTDDETLLSVGISGNAELAALDRERTGRGDALELARMAYLPDFNPMAGFTGSLSQFIGASVVLPTELPKIRAMIRESRADLRRVEAQAAQQRSDRAAEFVATLVALRDAERRAALFENDILPLAQRTVDLGRQGYSSGNVTYTDVIESQRTLLDIRMLIAEARASREKMLADLERLAGADVETLPITQPTTRPASQPATKVSP
jgi:outer membrane protein TolC